MILHIYAQEQWHGEAFIVGDSEALEKLRDAITHALEFGPERCSIPSFFASDGEGYQCFIMERSAVQIDRLAMPYTDPMASAVGAFGVGKDHPADLVSPEDKKQS